MDDERSAAQIKRLANWRTLRAFLVSVAPFEDRGAALVDDPLDASEAIVQMPASMAPSPLELIEGQPR
jgi:hypothetical protein